jgi:hypothetical protein
MSNAFPLLAFALVFVVAQRSLSLGLLAAIGVGYFSGIVRANFQSIATTFFFDAGIAGLYASILFGHTAMLKKAIMSPGGQFMLLLVGWPLFLTMVPVNHFFVQLIALRGSVWLLPIAIIATRFKKKDLFLLARGFAVLNIIAFGVGTYISINGVETLYPRNEVTRIIYNSKDVRSSDSSDTSYRVPSVFLSAHAYGNTMVLTIPILMGAVAYRRRGVIERGLLVAGVVAAIFGILYCAARQPMWVLGLILVVTWFQTGLSPKVGIFLALLAGIGLYSAAKSERFQRGFSTTTSPDGDRSYTFNRVYSSLNYDALDTFFKYPMGAGMGSSVGTSLPYFLSHVQPETIGHENEYSRIQVDQGWIGLSLWLAYILWSHFPRPKTLDRDMDFPLRMIHSTTGLFWATAFIGVGLLSSIPASAIMLLNMGFMVGQRDEGSRAIRLHKRLQTLKERHLASRLENFGNIGVRKPTAIQRKA